MDKPASVKVRQGVAAMIAEFGGREAATRIGVSDTALAHLAAGMAVKKITITLATMHLEGRAGAPGAAKQGEAAT